MNETKIFKENENMIHSIINKKYNRFLSYNTRIFDYDDLFQAGSIGLLNACRKFNSDADSKFSTFASVCIDNEIKHLITHNNAQKNIGNIQAISLYQKVRDSDDLYIIDTIGLDTSINSIINKDYINYIIYDTFSKVRDKNMQKVRIAICKDYVYNNMTHKELSKKYKYSQSAIGSFIIKFKNNIKEKNLKDNIAI